MIITADLALVLESLGKSPDAIAAALKAHGIQGIRNTSRLLNPICRFIEATFSLSPLSVEIHDRDTVRIALPDGRKIEWLLPEPIKSFLDSFNQGAYPALEVS